MSKSALPLIFAGGAALLFLSSKKRQRPTKSSSVVSEYSKEDEYQSSYEPAVLNPKKEPVTEPSKTSSGLSSEEKKRLIVDLGYPRYDYEFIRQFQIDWNALMTWLWNNNPNISPQTPGYGHISIDGKWGKETESRALRAIKAVPRDGTLVDIDGHEIHVNNFHDMVRAVYTFNPNSNKKTIYDEYLVNNLAPFLIKRSKDNTLVMGSALTGNELADVAVRKMMDTSRDNVLSEFRSTYKIQVTNGEGSSLMLIADLPDSAEARALNSSIEEKAILFQMGQWP